MSEPLDIESAIKRAHEVYEEFVNDPELRAAYEAREKFRKDYNTDMFLSRKEGAEEASKEIAIRMLKDEMPLESVVKYTELSIEKVESLKREIEGESAL